MCLHNVGRLPILVALDDLSEEDLVQVLTKPKNALIKQYRYMFSLEGVELNVTDEALLAIAGQAKKNEGGARSLRTIVESVLLEPMYRIPSEEVPPEVLIVDKDCITEGKEPVMKRENKQKAV